ncbi:MAG: FecCD family ABC transporter permease [Desulfitobacteriia bacterium]|jgi:iron complex transport system permease protein
MKNKKYFLLLIGFFLFISILVTLSLGSVRVPFGLTFKIILNQLPLLEFEQVWLDTQESIVVDLRLPRVFVAALIGAMLATAGVAFQGVLRNPLADPYILGISSGAAVGAAAAILLVTTAGTFLAKIAVPLFAFTGAILSLLLVFALAWRRKRDTVTMILAGVVIQSFLGALLSFAVTISGDKLRSIVFWMMGSLVSTGWSDFVFLLPYFLIGFLLILAFYRNLNILSLGEQAAEHLGMNVERIKILVLVAASLLTASAVSVVGIIGFVGLIVPHMIRIIAGPDHKILIPASCLAGAVFLLWSDTLARTIIPAMEIPIGVITALAGAPFFGYLLKKRV